MIVSATGKISPYAGEFINKLSPFATFQLYSPGKILPFVTNGVRNCYLVRTGSVSVYRTGDVLIGGWPAPCIIGLGQIDTAASFYFQTNEDCEIGEITRDEIFDIVEKQNLWQLLSMQMEFISSRLLNYATLLNAPSAYEIIRNQLLTLINEPTSLRESITAEKYIRTKTHLSRSGVMRILSELKKGEYIIMDEGILKEIRHLPAKY